MNTRIRTQHNGKINIILQENTNTDQSNKTELLHNQHKELQFIDEAFSAFIGLHSFKEQIKEIYAMRLIQLKREKMGLSIPKQSLHMIFKGNPGTGKTTIARKLAEVFGTLNILSKGHFIEAERADLVGEYIGQTAQKTRGLIQKSLGGVLFIDEAYSLARGGNKDFGREAIDTLVKQMEDYHRDFILILAGYPLEMTHFLQLNPGLESRFPFHIDFKNYSVDELIEIALLITSNREYELSIIAIAKLKKHLQEISYQQPTHFSNGRYIRNIIEQSIRRQSVRLLQENKWHINDLLEIKGGDVHLDLPFK